MNCAIHQIGSYTIVHFLLDCTKIGNDFYGSNKKLLGLKPSIWGAYWTPQTQGGATSIQELTPGEANEVENCPANEIPIRLLPSGGDTAQVLKKISGTDYNYSWQDEASGSGTPSNSVTGETAFGNSSNAGAATSYSRGDHTHGTPTNPVTGHESTYSHALLHSNTNDHAPGSDNQDLSGKVDKVTGSSLVTDTEIAKLAGVEAGANNYSHPANHAASIITQDASNRFVTDTEKGTWNGKEPGNSNIQTHVTAAHAPSNAQANADITKAEIEAKLTGELTSHTHAGGADPFTAKLVLSADKPTGANTTPVTLGLSFAYEANSKYVIDIYAIVAPTASSTGCGFLIDVSSAVTYVGTFTVHQLLVTGTLSGGSSIGDLGATSMGVSSAMVGAISNFVYGGGILVTGANTGTATFFFRSETTAVTTCKAGSMFRIMKMA